MAHACMHLVSHYSSKQADFKTCTHAVQELTDSSTYTQLQDNKLGRPYWVDLTLYITVGNLPQGSSLVYLSEATRWVQQLLRDYSSYEHYTVLYPTYVLMSSQIMAAYIPYIQTHWCHYRKKTTLYRITGQAQLACLDPRMCDRWYKVCQLTTSVCVRKQV